MGTKKVIRLRQEQLKLDALDVTWDKLEEE